MRHHSFKKDAMLRIITLNLNGIRSAARKGLLPWLEQQRPDIICFQEVKAQQKDLTPELQSPVGLNASWSLAEKAGYSGVGLVTRAIPLAINTGIGVDEFDREGRMISVELPQNLTVVSLYLPSGSSSDDRQAAKYRFMDSFLLQLEQLRNGGREVVICGDWNIAHQEADLKNWKGNQKNSGFLPEERAWLSQVLCTLGFVDVYRRLNPDATAACYTWWSNRGQAWANNVGWRLDYQIATPGIASSARVAEIYKATRFSDHAPLTIDYDWPR